MLVLELFNPMEETEVEIQLIPMVEVYFVDGWIFMAKGQTYHLYKDGICCCFLW